MSASDQSGHWANAAAQHSGPRGLLRPPAQILSPFFTNSLIGGVLPVCPCPAVSVCNKKKLPQGPIFVVASIKEQEFD